MNLSSLLKRTADRYPKNIAIVEDKEKIAYERLQQKIEVLSDAFRSIGIRKNSKVAILLPNCKEFIYSFFALLKINAIAVPIKPQITCWELGELFKNCTPKVLILAPALLNRILRDKPSLLRNRIIIVKEGTVEAAILDKNDGLSESVLYAINELYEMGKNDSRRRRKIATTNSRQIASINYTYRGYGYPLGAMLTHANYIYGAFNYMRHRKSSSDETILLALPSAHILPLVGCIIVSLLAGAKIVILENRSTRYIFRTISRDQVNILVLVPTLFSALVRYYNKSLHDISSLKYGITGGSYMSPKLNRLIKETMHFDVIQGYGLTECMPVTCNYLENNRPETLGLPLHKVQIKIVDEKGKECGPGQIGEILIKTPQLMAGYYNNPRDTMRVIKDGWLLSGDYGMMDEEGYLHFEGLKKEMVNVGGNAVDLLELRNRILSVEGFKAVTFNIQDDDLWGQKIEATAIARKDTPGLTANQLKRILRKYLSLYKIPSELFVTDNS